MPFDPARDLPVILGSLAGMGRGSNAFSRRWMQLEQMRQQQQMQEQQLARQDRAEARQGDFQQQDLMLRSDAARRAEEQQRLGYTENIQKLFTDPNVDPDVALQLATMGLPPGYDAGAVQSMHARVFTPDERTRRKAAKRLAEIENDPQVKRHIAANQDLSATTWESPDLGANPEDPQGRPIYTMAQLQRLAQKPVPAAPLPKIATGSDVNAGSFEEFSTATPERQAAILAARRAYTEAGREPDRAPQGTKEWVIGQDGQQHYRVPIPGDRKYDAVAERQTKDAETISQYSLDQATRTITAIDDVLPNISNLTAGVGSVLSRFPGTPAANVRAELASVAGNIAFQALQAMREASKTGGALGQVSDIELRLLSSVEGAIAQDQSPANLRRQLTKIRESMERLKAAAEQQRMNGGTVQLGPGVTTGQAPDGWIDVGGGVRIREKK